MLTRACGILLFGLTLALTPAAPAFARPPVASPAVATPLPDPAEPVQFYVFSLNDTPVAEAAQAVVGGALSYDLDVDPAVEGLVTFRADGWYGSEALLQDFGAALLDQDVALMQTAPRTYALIPRANIAVLRSRGGVLMTRPEPAGARPPVPAAMEAPATVYGQARWWDGAFGGLLLFFGGALAGGAALLAGLIVYCRAQARPPVVSPRLRLTDQQSRDHPSAMVTTADPDLVIPRFDPPPRV